MTADKRRIDACLKACEGISTQNLEDNVPVLELARRYNALLRDNTALRAKVESMEKQGPSREWWDNLIADISAIDCVYRGCPSYAHDAYWLREHVVQMFEHRRDAIPSAQPAPSTPEGWLRAIDAALVVAHIGVANADDTYEQAKARLDRLVGFHVDVATDPAVNGGWKLVPTAESRHPGIYKMLSVLHAVYNTPGASEWESYAAMLAAAPEAKP